MATAKIQERASYAGANATSTTVAHKVRDGGNRMLLVMLFARDTGTVTAPTYGGTSLTLVPGSEISASTSTTRRYSSWYYMLAPTAGSASLVLAVASRLFR